MEPMSTELTVFPKARAKLSENEKRFVMALLATPDFNVAAAARAVGYRNAKVAGHRLMQRPAVKAAITKKQRERAKRTEITVDRVLQEIAAIALADPADMLRKDGSFKSLRQMPKSVRACIKDLNVGFQEAPDEEGNFRQQMFCTVKMHDKIAALQLLAKHVGLVESPATRDKILSQTNIVAIDWDAMYEQSPTTESDKIESYLLDQEAEARRHPAVIDLPAIPAEIEDLP